MKRVKDLFPILISDENLDACITNVNKEHHYVGHGSARRVNKITLWVECTREERREDLRQIILKIISGEYTQRPTRHIDIYDVNAQKWRGIDEPVQWPDQYIHHALQQCLEPVMMRGMDYFCCASIKKRGSARGLRYIKRWTSANHTDTRYGMECDIRHFYNSINPQFAFQWFKNKIKDWRVLSVIWAVIGEGVTIGGFFSQWVANSILQPLDHMIRQSKLCSHYVRYIDNFTIFGKNLRKLKMLMKKIEDWLLERGLFLKSTKQIFRLNDRMVSAFGYRFNHHKVFLRKRNVLGIMRKVRRIRSKLEKGMPICYSEASGALSKLGQLKHCNSFHFRNNLCPKGFVKEMKSIVRIHSKRKESRETWKYMLSQFKMDLKAS